MQAHEVMKEVLRKTSAKQIAAEMQLSLSLIYKWAEPPSDESGSGTGSPLDRVGQLIRITKDTRAANGFASRPADFSFPIPKTFRAAPRSSPATNDIVHEFADMLSTIAVTSEDNVITKDEAKRIRARWEELKSVTEGFVAAAETGTFGPPKTEAKKA